MAALAQRLDEAPGGAPAAGAAVRPAEIPLSFAQRRLWFLHRLEGPSATYNIPLALRLKGALDVTPCEAALGDVVARHESLRTIFPDTLGVPRQLILAASAARPRLAVGVRERGGVFAEALAAAARHGFDLANEPPLRAHLFVLGAQRACAVVAAAPHRGRRLVDGAAGARSCGLYAARCRGTRRICRRCRCNMPTIRCGSTRFSARRTIRRARLRASLRSGRSASARAAGTARSADRPPAARGVELSRRQRAAAAGGRAARRLLALARDSGASLFMVLQAGLAACSRGWARAPTSRSAPRLRDAPTARSTISSASSSIRWCCAPTRPAIRASAS